MRFSDFSLRPEILQAVAEAGYEVPTPIQEQAIPVLLAGKDVLGIAQTGTGKTAAFVLPMIERLAQGQAKARMPRSLILSPTRELATQTSNYFETYGKYVKLNMALLIGGVSMEEQWRQLDRGVDVLIATPGRLIDQFERGRILLGGVSILVIDEADRMLDMGFIPDVERITKLLTRRQQTLMFSATMPAEVRRLANAFLRSPQELQATPPATMAERIEDHLTVVPPRQKFKALRRIIETQEVGKAIIFCNRKREVASLRRQLERAGMNVRDIHGDLDQSQRTQALDAFKRGEIDFLVATDVAARGLDISKLPCVINYDVPTHADDYIHRIGRTGRAGEEGRAFTLALPEDARFVQAITKLTGKPIARLELEGLDGSELSDGEDGGRRRRGREANDQPVRETPPEAETRGRRRRNREADDQPTVEAQPQEELRGRRRRSRAAGASGEERAGSREAGPEPAAPTTEMPAAAPEPQAPAAEPREAVAEPASPRAKPARSSGRAPRTEHKGDRPVVGMGDHVPLFMLRPVPAPSMTDPSSGEE